MNKALIIILSFCTFIVNSQVSKTVNLTTSGTLSTELTSNELLTTTNLTVTGSIDQRDFKTITNSMPAIAKVDISGASIVAYSSYLANQLPFMAFGMKPLITSIVLPNGVTNINDAAFTGCTGLTSINIPNSITYIGYRAFEKCTGLSSIEIPALATQVRSTAFSECSALSSITVNSSNTSFASQDGVLMDYNKTKIIAYPPGILGVYNVPASVTTIDDYTFNNCKLLTEINVPASVTTIPSSCMNYCPALTAINVNAANADFSSSNGILYNKTKTSILRVPEGKTGSFTIDSSVETINNFSFFNCSNLSSITIPSSVKTIKFNALTGCSSINKLTIPNSVTSIEGNSIKNCTSLTEVIMPESLTTIYDATFAGCTSLTTVSFPQNLTTISYLAFSQCSALKNLILPSTVTYIGNSAFAQCSKLETIEMPASLEEIGNYAFSQCSKLQSVAFKSGLKIVGQNAFLQCTSLQRINIPASVTSIGYEAFVNCTSLIEIIAEAETPVDLSTTYNVFGGVSKSNSTLYVPTTASQSLYHSADQWKDFYNQKVGVPVTLGQNNASFSPIKIYTTNNAVVVEGGMMNENIIIYDICGKIICNKIHSESKTTINTNVKGIFIVKVGEKCAKIRL